MSPSSPTSSQSVPPAYILCGGESSRFGSDKARALIDGVPQIVRLKQKLESHGHKVFLVADRKNRYQDLGLEALVDTYKNAGPLGGLAAALNHQEALRLQSHGPDDGEILLVNCDQYEWQPKWIDELREEADELSLAAAYYTDDWQPLPGLYSTSLLFEIESRMERDEPCSLKGLLDKFYDEGYATRVETLNSPNRSSFNTPEQLQALIVDSQKAPLQVVIVEANLANEQDANDVLRLTNHYAQHPMGGSAPLPDAVQKRLIQGLREHPTTLIFFAKVNGEAVGIATCFVGFSTFAARKLINVHDLAVHRDYQGKGIGRKLLEHVIEVARQRGYASVTLEVRTDNTPGRKLYSSLGFKLLEGDQTDETMLFGKCVVHGAADIG